MASSNLTLTLLAVLSIDIILFLAQISTGYINQEYNLHEGNIAFYNYNESYIKSYDKGGYNVIDADSSELPEAKTGSVIKDSLNFLTDNFKTASGWLSAGKRFLTFVGGPTHYIKLIGAPQEVVFSIGALWYGLTIFLIVAFLIGRVS